MAALGFLTIFSMIARAIGMPYREWAEWAAAQPIAAAIQLELGARVLYRRAAYRMRPVAQKRQRALACALFEQAQALRRGDPKAATTKWGAYPVPTDHNPADLLDDPTELRQRITALTAELAEVLKQNSDLVDRLLPSKAGP